MRIAREEIFGPVLSVTPYDDLDDAIRMANDTRYGLSGMVLSKNKARAIQVAKQLRTGSVLIAGGLGAPSARAFMMAPFGGFKESGIGREGGTYGIMEFTETQSIVW
jgi:acyl-CoA reductase-like NAD-dependent aldehyde dehydrogenase